VPGVIVPQSVVAEQDGRPAGLAQMKPRREPRQWEVVYLAVESLPASPKERRPSVPGLHVVPDRRAAHLLGHLCDAGVTLGAERLLASIEDEQRRIELFTQVGFSPVLHEYTFYRPLDAPQQEPSMAPPPVRGLRPQQRADAFGLQQLYQECTPKVVQMAEGKRPLSWELRSGMLDGRLGQRTRAQRWVVERDARQVGWLQMSLHRRGPHQLRLMVDQRAPDLNGTLVEFALAQLSHHPAPGVLVRVREHQSNVIRALEEYGFYQVSSDLLMVKLLAAPVLQPHLAPALEKVV
jgi:hypothetical protein